MQKIFTGYIRKVIYKYKLLQIYVRIRKLQLHAHTDTVLSPSFGMTLLAIVI